MAVRTLFADPMLRMLTAAILLAAVWPAAGDWRDLARAAADAGIFILFLLNGMRVARGEIAAGAANWRFILPLVIWVFGAMAFAGLGFSILGQTLVPPLVAAGFLYLGALPTTVQSSTSYSSLAGGNIALSVIAAALLSMLGVFVSVPIFLALGGTGEGGVGGAAIIKILAILVLPFAIGQIVQDRTRAFVTEHKGTIVWLDRCVIALAVYVAFSGAVEQGIWTRIDVAGWLTVGAMIIAFLAVGHFGTWLLSGALRLPRADRIAFLFAGAQKSAALGAPLATVLFPPAVAGFIVLPLLLYHLFQLVLAAPLASRLATLPDRDASGCNAPTTEG